MYAIRFFLGFGKVRFQFSQRMVHFVIEDTASMLLLAVTTKLEPTKLRLVANLLNGRFRTPAKWDAFGICSGILTKDDPIDPLPLNPEIDYNRLAGCAGITEGDSWRNICYDSSLLLYFYCPTTQHV